MSVCGNERKRMAKEPVKKVAENKKVSGIKDILLNSEIPAIIIKDKSNTRKKSGEQTIKNSKKNKFYE